MQFYLPLEYQQQCLSQFKDFQEKIHALLPNAKIEHIGSSAVNGLISKGDLDIYVEVPEPQLEAAIPLLKTLAFVEKQDTLRTPQLCMLEHQTKNCAIQLVAKNSEFEFFLYFRDALRQSKLLQAQYNQLKQSCVDCDEDEYRIRKAKFIQAVLAQYRTKN